MKLVEAMPREEFTKVCDIGSDLVSDIIKKLDAAGIGHEHLANTLAVAVGGAVAYGQASGQELKPEEFSELVEMSCGLWSVKTTAPGKGRLEFQRPVESSAPGEN